MATYTDVFGNETLPPSNYGYSSVTLTANTTFQWPYNAQGTDVTSKIMEVSASAGLTMTLPDATQVSTGEDLLIRNTGAETFTVNDNAGGILGTVAAGVAKYFYLTDNATAAGAWSVLTYGVGTSTVDAATLVGYGIKAIGATLNQSHPVFPTATDITIDSTYRAQMVVFTGGSETCTLPAVATIGDDFFFLLRNAGTGTLTIDADAAETIDGQTTLTLQPTESLMLFCSGSAWYSVGYGRSVLYNFTQLVLDVSAAGTFTLSASQASNKLMSFTGNPASAVTVVVPNVVAVYYLQSAISTTSAITVKTAAGTGVTVPQSQRIIAICDSTDVVSAQSVAANTTLSLTDGSAATPSLNFASSTDTGLYKYGASGLGVAVAGVSMAQFDTTGCTLAGATTVTTINKLTLTAPATTATLTIANNKTFTVNNTLTLAGTDSTVMTFPGASDTVVTLAASQTLTNKTLTAPAINGTVATTGLTLPALTLGGAITGNSQNISGLGTVGCGAITSTGAITGTSLWINGATADWYSFDNGGGNSYWTTSASGAGCGVAANATTLFGMVGGTAAFNVTSSAFTLGSGITSLAFSAGNPSLSIGTGALTAGSGTFSKSGSDAAVNVSTDVTAGYAILDLKNTGASGKEWQIVVGGNSATVAPNALGIYYATGSQLIGTFSSTGLAVTGTGTFTGAGNALIKLENNSVLIRNSNATAAGTISFQRNDGTQKAFIASYYNTANEGNLEFGTNSTTNMTLDASGNLGLGVTPSAWSGVVSKVLEFQNGSAIGSQSNTYNLHLLRNAYFDNGWKYKNTAAAARFALNDDAGTGGFSWYYAGSGTAGTAISWGDPKMSLDASGLAVSGSGTFSGNTTVGDTSSGDRSLIVKSTSVTGIVGSQTSYSAWGGGITTYPSMNIGSTTNHPVIFGANNTGYMTLDTSGNLGVGGAAASCRIYAEAPVSNNGIVAKIASESYYPLIGHNGTTSGDGRFAGFYTEGAGTLRGDIDYNRAGGLVRYNTTSDATLKNIIGDADLAKSLTILDNTRLREYSWKDDATNKSQLGVIAQEVYDGGFEGAVSVGGEYEEVVPAVTEQRLVTEAVFNDDGEEIEPAVYETVEITPETTVTKYRPWGVDKTAWTFHLIAGYQAQKKQIEDLTALVQTLAAKVAALESA